MISARAKANNAAYADAQNAERDRRKQEGLAFTSLHWDSHEHFKTQNDFRVWFRETFSDARGIDSPIWTSATTKAGEPIRHHWLLANKDQMMVAKLAWG